MDFLKKDQKIKVIPENIEEISGGTIIEVASDYFSVSLNNPHNDLEIDSNIEFIITDKDFLIRFEAKIIQIKDNVVCFSLPQEFKYMQRREYTRVDINIPVNLTEINNPDTSADTLTTNLSGGGLQVISRENFDIGTLLKAKFNILNKKDVRVVMEILRMDKNLQNNEEYLLSGEFADISNTNRTAIIQLCFKRQLELRCKIQK